MSVIPARIPMRVRSIFISDVHLGYRGCRAEYLDHFLQSVQAQNVFIVGDLVDFWALERSYYWPASHQSILRRLAALARAGKRIVVVPGNHDDVLRDYCGLQYGGVEIHREFVHETADGRRLLLFHGDQFDESVIDQFSPLVKRLGGLLYDVMLEVNHLLHSLRHRLGYGYWSLADWIKRQVPDAERYIARFEAAAAGEARRRGFDGAVCGHIHRSALRDLEGVLYCNAGDWVESCTSLVEDMNGRLSVLRWTERSEMVTATGHVPVVLEPAA